MGEELGFAGLSGESESRIEMIPSKTSSLGPDRYTFANVNVYRISIIDTKALVEVL